MRRYSIYLDPKKKTNLKETHFFLQTFAVRMTGRRGQVTYPSYPEPGRLLHVVPNGLSTMRKVPCMVWQQKTCRKVGIQESETSFLYLFSWYPKFKIPSFCCLFSWWFFTDSIMVKCPSLKHPLWMDIFFPSNELQQLQEMFCWINEVRFPG